MGALHGGNGGERPPDGGGLPELPPEWGHVVIPDDASALTAESVGVRRQMRRYARSRRWRRRLHLPPPPHRISEDSQPGLAAPLIVMAIAVLATLASLFAVGWPTQRRPVAPVRSVGGPAPASTASADSPQRGVGPLANMTLADPSGADVWLAGSLPALVLLVDGCACEAVISSAAAAADPRVTVLAVATSWPETAIPAAPDTAGARIERVVDPGGRVRAAIVGASANGPAAALVAADGSTLKVVPVLGSVDDFRADLPRLVPAG